MSAFLDILKKSGVVSINKEDYTPASGDDTDEIEDMLDMPPTDEEVFDLKASLKEAGLTDEQIAAVT